MMATKKTLFVVFAVLLVALVLFSLNLKGNNLFKEHIQYTVSQSDRPSYTNLDDITKASDAVFIGTVDSIAGTRNLARNPKDPSKEDENITVEGVDYKVTVLEYLKGSDGNQVLVTEQKQNKLDKNEPFVKDEHYIGLNPGATYVFFAKKSTSTGRYYSAGDPFFFELKNNTVKLLTTEDNLKTYFKDTDVKTFKDKVKNVK